MVVATPIATSVIAAAYGTVATTPRQFPSHPVAANEAFARTRGAGYERAVLAARRHAAVMPVAQRAGASSALQWTPLGPQPETNPINSEGGANSGRVTGLAVAPATQGSPQTLYLASAGGGVWSSTTNGASWATHTDSQPDIAMGSVGVDPSNRAYVFAGTGEDNACQDCHFGDGVLESLNGGSTWTTSNPGGVFTGQNISSVVVLPGASSIATTTVLVGGSMGLYVSTDGGATWAPEAGAGFIGTDANTQSIGDVTSLIVDAASTPVAVYAFVTGVGVERSVDGGSTWSTSQPMTSGNGALTISPSAAVSSAVLYDSVGSSNGYVGMFKSVDGGATWTALANCTSTVSTSCVPYFTSPDYAYNGTPDDNGGDQSSYDNVVAVDPLNANIVVAGGIALIESTDGGVTWSNLNGGVYSATASSLFHPDFHALVFDGAGNLYFGNDGGVWEMTAANVATATTSFVNLNATLNITQFYGGIAQSNNGAQILAGAQDNGTNLYSGSATWNEVASGDGGFSAIDPANPLIQYAEADISSAANGGAGGGLSGTTDGWASTNNALTTPSFASANWVAPLAVVPNTTGPTLLFGANGVTTSTDGGVTWSALTGYSGSDVSALALAPSNPQVVYAGFDDGTLEMSSDGGTTWSTITSSAATSDVTHISVSATDPYTAYVTYAANASTGVTNGNQNSPDVVVGTALNSTPTWTNVTGDLPTGVTTNSVVSDGANGLIVATDAGVYWAPTLNAAATRWSVLGTGLPNVQAMDLVLTSNNTLIVTTHGRGVWTLAFTATASVPGAPTNVAVAVARVATVLRWVAPVSTGGSPVTGYSVLADDVTTNARLTNVCARSIARTTTSCTATGLTYGDTYTFSVAATNIVGTGPLSSPSNAVTAPSPQLPQSPLRVVTRSGYLGRTLHVVVRGGSGRGRVSLRVVNGTARGCAISGVTLRATRAGTCIVRATKARDGSYRSAVSVPTAVAMILPARPRPLTLSYAKGTSTLSATDQSALTRLAGQLLVGASLQITGNAPGNVKLAQRRVVAVARFLFRVVRVRVSFRLVTGTSAQSVVVATLRQ